MYNRDVYCASRTFIGHEPEKSGLFVGGLVGLGKQLVAFFDRPHGGQQPSPPLPYPVSNPGLLICQSKPAEPSGGWSVASLHVFDPDVARGTDRAGYVDPSSALPSSKASRPPQN